MNILDDRDYKSSLSNIGYTSSREANKFIFETPLAYVFGLIFDQSISSDLAWKSPLRLHERMGHFDVKKISKMSNEKLKKLIAEKKSLHRYPGVVAKYLISSSLTIVSSFGGKAENIWASDDVDIVKKNFLKLKGIGEKKSNLAVMMLARDHGIIFRDLSNLPLAIDVHLERVLKRSGLFDIETKLGIFEVMTSFKEKKPRFPAILGTPLWYIGKTYCHKINPDCLFCPQKEHCGKKGVV